MARAAPVMDLECSSQRYIPAPKPKVSNEYSLKKSCSVTYKEHWASVDAGC